MYYLKHFWILLSISNLGKALKSCSEHHKILSVCLISEENYEDPIPAYLETWLYLTEIIEINENENSFSISVELVTYWTDPRLALSNSKE